MNSLNGQPCFVFAMGAEAAPFLRRLEIRRTWRSGKATFREARFEGSNLMVIRCGVGPVRAAKAIQAMDCAPSCIISVGTAGALSPALAVGDIVIADRTLLAHEPGVEGRASESLGDELAAACAQEGVPYRRMCIATSRHVVFDPADRTALHTMTGAHSVDMESHSICCEAARRGIPFASLRIVTDDLSSPPLPDPRTLKQLWRRPHKLPENIRKLLRLKHFWAQFLKSVEVLPPILVRFLRTDKGGQDGMQESVRPLVRQ